ncbi:hypothetical protein [Nonomuraea sp. NPDC050310]|uniref:hypothetical protein n=1 Tax=Nonomuraea sp. NPDC050310 TaxID=3154935 RepID=UPI003404FAEE
MTSLEETGRRAHCRSCSEEIAELDTGVWRLARKTPDDRVPCPLSPDQRHHPQEDL